MNILMLSYDRDFISENPTGDTLLRHKHYAKYLDKLDVIIAAPGQRTQTKIAISERFSIFPSYGCCSLLSWLRAYSRARQICKHSKVDIVVSQDPLIGILGILLRREFGCKLQVNIFGCEILDDKSKTPRPKLSLPLYLLYKHIKFWVLKRADMVRTDVNRDRDRLIQKLKLQPDKVVVIPVIPAPETIKRFREMKEVEEII